MKVEERSAVFALLDDCEASTAAPSSRLYTRFVREHVCTDGARLEEVCEAVAAEVNRGLHAVVLGDYEFGRDLELKQHATQRGGNASLRFLLFEHCEKRSREQVDAWLAQMDGGQVGPSVAGAAHVAESVTPAQFDAAIAAVHEALRAGESYQINYTYRLTFDAFGPPVALYRRLRARQPVRYGALIALPDGAWIVSCSPELFVEKAGTRLRTRPMKGTTARGATPEEDARAQAFLRNDPKNRAENLMIVDLLRNDLSRVAKTGTVCVPALFSVEPYPSIWGMTSTIEADLREDTSFAGVLRALFPCGSITGAPKHRTMELIDEIETTPRGLYTGTIGWLDAQSGDEGQRDACGDFCLSVTIRTLTLAAPDSNASGTGMRRGMMGVGGGIVLDSVAADEYAECRLKAKFLTGADPGFELFETMLATHEGGVRHRERHVSRLASSAAALGFAFDPPALRTQLDACCAQLPPGVPHRMRVALAKGGGVQLQTASLGALKTIAGLSAEAGETETVGVLLGPEHGFAPTSSGEFLLKHKTTARAEYDRAWREAEAHGAFDMLFFNERGELTEGGRSNVFVKLDGQWWTPPLAAGLLPGVMRQVLLEDAAWQARERVLTREDLLNAQALIICNALRGALPARVITAEQAR
ncbi:aminodeoxychorismate synthase component I [Trinickia fusca]|uniref:Aminodeoxychorismate synthase component I n=1 Tax=Trinickia fusca TaxID=2419777 RepID=A0A494XJV9_9BURK|nr:aminodeoxychorismate synthase component I [Trinickia fusca]RKP51017.1 aminodeoxychorismate synthase component I [Trinickia fusca]